MHEMWKRKCLQGNKLSLQKTAPAALATQYLIIQSQLSGTDQDRGAGGFLIISRFVLAGIRDEGFSDNAVL